MASGSAASPLRLPLPGSLSSSASASPSPSPTPFSSRGAPKCSRGQEGDGDEEDDEEREEVEGEDPEGSRDQLKRWATAAFAEFCGPEAVAAGRVSIARLRHRAAERWFREVLRVAAVRRQRQALRPLRTSHVVAIFCAKATRHEDACLSCDEFTAGAVSLVKGGSDEELVWALLDVLGEGRVRAEGGIEGVAALWSAVGIPCLESDIQSMRAAAEAEDDGWLTLERFRGWSRQGFDRPRSSQWSRMTPRQQRLSEEAAFCGTVASFGRTDMASGPGARIADARLRSAEAGGTVLFKNTGDRLWDLSEIVRVPEPARPLSRKLPGAAGRAAAAGGDAAALRLQDADEGARPNTVMALPPKPSIGWEAFAELEARRQARFRPFMQVKASYVKHGGGKAECIGTLLTGWGVPNRASSVPHALPPEGVRRAGTQTYRSPAPVGLREREKWRDEEHFVGVQIHGRDRLIPRAWVTPMSAP
mmetsp:Transcript_53118/g.150358  ORF Transcript_53118/g.150358 Transcript_53118/m.150358 type:complete len:476 (+) Transcript_53118:92-1519(+)